jgi:Na+/H+-dicarboxylate symporter
VKGAPQLLQPTVGALGASLPAVTVTVCASVQWPHACQLSVALYQFPTEVAAAHCPLWLARDRFRTMINVLGDALAAGIMAHICRKDFAQDMGTEVRVVSFQEASKTVLLNL